MLYKISNLYIYIYYIAYKQLCLCSTKVPARVLLSLQLQLTLKTGPNHRRKNLPTSDKLTVIILDAAVDAQVCKIMLAAHGRQDRSCYQQISSAHAAYILLHYMLLFPKGNLG